jgi:hypothetical protein
VGRNNKCREVDMRALSEYRVAEVPDDYGTDNHFSKNETS